MAFFAAGVTYDSSSPQPQDTFSDLPRLMVRLSIFKINLNIYDFFLVTSQILDMNVKYIILQVSLPPIVNVGTFALVRWAPFP